ncbi:MAG: transporter substrate-binding domain-containing protein [Clostridiales bacterium]|nr:transporter substrate-binding domain-containing protein [Clostridiales bacterium]
MPHTTSEGVLAIRKLKLLLGLTLAFTMLSSCVGASPGANSGAALENNNSSQPADTSLDASQEAAENSEQPADTDSGASQDDWGLLKPGVLQVGCEIGYPPFEYFSDDGVTPVGVDIDLGDAIAAELGVSVERIDTAWDGIFAGLAAKKYDVIISAVTINAERMENMDFSMPYIENWQSIVIKKGGSTIAEVKDLDGKNVAYQDATTSDEYLDDLINTGVLNCERFEYAKVMNCFDDLNLGRVDAVLCDSTVADGYIAREPDKFEISWLQSSEPDSEPETFGIAIKKGNEKLLNAINDALKKLDESGKLDEIRTNWFS